MGELYLIQLHPCAWMDVTCRARRILGEVDLVVAGEGLCLAQSGIAFAAVPVLDPGEIEPQEVTQRLLSVLERGDVAWLLPEFVEWPLGERALLGVLLRHGVEAVSVPGPAEWVSALVTSGLPGERFSYGTLSSLAWEREKVLLQARADRHTLVFGVRGIDRQDALQEARSILGHDRQVVLVDSLQLWEKVYEGDPFRSGRAYLVIEGASDDVSWPEERVRQALSEMLAGQHSTRDAVKAVSERSHWRKRAVYEIALEIAGR